MSPLPKRALLAITSYHGPFYPNGDNTGLYYTEALHPYTVLTAAGFQVDLASETGEYGIDPHSVTKTALTDADALVYNDKQNDFNQKLAQIKKASDLDPTAYGLFFASAGHGTLFDYPKAKGLIAIAESVWARGGVVSAVCHAPAILPHIKDQATGKSIINGRTVTGFTDKGEVELNLMDKIKELGLVPITQGAVQAGATYKEPEGAFDVFTVVDGRLVTGANPPSAHATAVKAVEAFDKL
ncbi:plasma membrane heat shock protein [Coemansia sp. RSA 2523]|nr:plasma membrane heat shock protein [Coemansia sp. RSA 1591]KAJ1756524.1 plasma membrane heat shock protein [Coemansia sp. RSA 1752]KAJ1793033.1 plasma membrane heat shock protein [Coemansia sp. RSA 2167]KAJ1800863.1 plasma membrane heat shock protein [Coemansia sp. RSA 2523]KAJ2154158.1 plasma membrane heat shock protein [Coemansia sp. RSA 637]KAJ2260944.1 plasma membrane heat shock protein [Coemansia sp. RSA 451]KAJ2547099.1 plasma membrane heat shock protein [Coemansia sp. RSA 1878]KAJ2